MNVNVLIFKSVARRRRSRFFKIKNFFDFREFTFSFDVSHNAFSKILDYSDYDMHSLVFFLYDYFKATIDWLYDL